MSAEPCSDCGAVGVIHYDDCPRWHMGGSDGDAFRDLVFNARVVGFASGHGLRLASRSSVALSVGDGDGGTVRNDTRGYRIADTHFAVTRPIELTARSRGSRDARQLRTHWQLTHTPTGLKITGARHRYREPLIAVAAVLTRAFPACDWSQASNSYYTTSPGGISQATIGRVLAIVLPKEQPK